MSDHLDGNVLAGMLGELFTMDITTAVAECVSCGSTGPIARVHVYADAPGVTARCPACGQAMFRLVRGPGRAWLDLRGITCLQLTLPAGATPPAGAPAA
jgi:Zn finger protein HypA/HybF involved in hydrogenase expression